MVKVAMSKIFKDRIVICIGEKSTHISVKELFQLMDSGIKILGRVVKGGHRG